MEESGILGVPAAKDGLILLTVAELAAPGENREFSKTPISIANLLVGRIADYCRPVEIAMD